jgi:uncharacterized membrane protein YkvA (DUF1232 family)
MPAWLVGLVVVLAVYAVIVVALILAGRREAALALAALVPDCVVLVRRLIGDARVPRWGKALLGLLAVYLVSPIDLVPDFLPVVGQLDDVVITIVVLRIVLRSGGPDLVREHWPGPASSLKVVLRTTFGER